MRARSTSPTTSTPARPRSLRCTGCGRPWEWPFPSRAVPDRCHACASPSARSKRRALYRRADLPLPMALETDATDAEQRQDDAALQAARADVAATNIVARVLDGLLRDGMTAADAVAKLAPRAAAVLAILATSLLAACADRVAGPRATPGAACPALVVSDTVKNDARAFAAADSAHQAACARRIP